MGTKLNGGSFLTGECEWALPFCTSARLEYPGWSDPLGWSERELYLIIIREEKTKVDDTQMREKGKDESIEAPMKMDTR
ncbi:hypothetical protein POVCU2_0022170 [Plasmodium ovale curtisi]|uniref:Uncharacterized protein n=1 Tax=Plasmodium ovale curtisi TaxID=864141 RepID=A0A1A8VVE9_PLAOA|nr:hypothetical protein POVCU2_0022170 [Plasmodium ovale curtisi]SBT00432.1 hypothetical protein POVCU1_059930 [Plasmodium ovale curtisi]